MYMLDRDPIGAHRLGKRESDRVARRGVLRDRRINLRTPGDEPHRAFGRATGTGIDDVIGRAAERVDR